MNWLRSLWHKEPKVELKDVQVETDLNGNELEHKDVENAVLLEGLKDANKKLKDNENAVLECSICQEHFQKNDVYKTDCKHLFHKKCIADWYNSKDDAECPECRCVLRDPDEDKDEQNVLLLN